MERYSITIDDAVMKKVREKAESLNMPINTYLSNFIAEHHTDSNISFDNVMKSIYAEIESRPKGKFILNDLKSFKNIKIMKFDGIESMYNPRNTSLFSTSCFLTYPLVTFTHSVP